MNHKTMTNYEIVKSVRELGATPSQMTSDGITVWTVLDYMITTDSRTGDYWITIDDHELVKGNGTILDAFRDFLAEQ